MNLFAGTVTITYYETVARDTIKCRFAVKNAEHLITKEPLVGKLPFEAGQFISLQFTEKAWRAYSIASHPDENEIELVVRLVPGGVGSEKLREAKVGDDFNFKAPFGHFVLSENADANLVFIGTGTGIAPLRSMILAEQKSPNPRKMKIFYGGRNAEDISYLDEINGWAPENLSIRLGFSRAEDVEKLPENAEKCRVTKFLEDGDFDSNSEFYICGNGDMVKSVQEIIDANDIPESRVFMERFN